MFLVSIDRLSRTSLLYRLLQCWQPKVCMITTIQYNQYVVGSTAFPALKVQSSLWFKLVSVRLVPWPALVQIPMVTSWCCGHPSRFNRGRVQEGEDNASSSMRLWHLQCVSAHTFRLQLGVHGGSACWRSKPGWGTPKCSNVA